MIVNKNLTAVFLIAGLGGFISSTYAESSENSFSDVRGVASNERAEEIVISTSDLNPYKKVVDSYDLIAVFNDDDITYFVPENTASAQSCDLESVGIADFTTEEIIQALIRADKLSDAVSGALNLAP